MDQMRQQLKTLLSADLTSEAVHYPAVSVKPSNPFDIFNGANGLGAAFGIGFLGAYTDSVREGTANTQALLESYHALCPSSRFILGGYSQGAQAVGDALQRMPQADRNLVAAAGFFGDPYFNAKSSSGRGGFSPVYYGALGHRDEWPAALSGKVFSYCHDGDPICNIRHKVHVWGTPIDMYVLNPLRLDFDKHTSYASLGDGTRAADDIAQALGYALSAAPLDVVFAIDTTGSMGGAIGTVQSSVVDLASTIASETTNFRFGLVDYKDEPAQGSAYQARVDIDLTSDLGAFQDSVNTLTANGGGDTPESVYDGVETALSLSWRPEAARSVVLIGDAAAKDPEPITGYTLGSVGTASAAAAANVFAVQVGSDSSAGASFSDIAAVTGGEFFPSGFIARSSARSLSNRRSAAHGPVANRSDLLTQLEAALKASAKHVNAVLGGPYVGYAGQPIALSAAASTSSDGAITSYAWDFNNDGTVDQTTTGPVVERTYGAAGSYTAQVTVATTTGATSSTTTPVTVAPASVPLSAPSIVSATGQQQQVSLRWTKGSSGIPSGYIVADDAGDTWTVAADSSGKPPSEVVVTGLADATTYHFTVAALNAGGVTSSVAFPPVTTLPATGIPSAGIAGISFFEGDAGRRTADMALTLQSSTTRPVTVNYQVLRASGDTATPGSDFVATSGTVTFQPINAGRTGTSMFVPLTVFGDTAREGNETFTVRLTGATNAVVGVYKSARATILNDDPGSGLRATVSNAAIVEGNTVATVGGSNAAAFHITLSRPVPAGHAPVVIKYLVTGNTATGGSGPASGVDFLAVTTPVSLTFKPGEQDKRVLVRVFADPFVEPDETFSFRLTGISGGATIMAGVGIGTIRNDD